jgi:toxin ParE1/3/4
VSGANTLPVPGYQFTDAADGDVEDILRASGIRFGPGQREIYARLIDQAAAMVAEDPERLGSFDRAELGEGVRSFHLELAVRRRGAASHVLYYVPGRLVDGAVGVIIVRVLHERMEPDRHVVRGLADR